MPIKPESIKLDEYEQAIEDNFEKMGTCPPEIQAEIIKMLQQAAENHLKKRPPKK